MKAAVLSDIHGNLPALEAVLRYVGPLKVDTLVNLGDCISGPLWPAETCALLQSLPMRTVRGNHDRAVGQAESSPPGASDRFAWERTAREQHRWLAELPFELELALPGGAARCFHANPLDDEAYLIDEVADGRLRLADTARISARLGPVQHPVILCGHSHQPRVVRLPEGAIIVNPGSVGCPAYADAGPPPHMSETGAPHARFALVTADAGGIGVELVAVAYDWDAAAAAATRNGRPDWAHALRTGRAMPE